MYEKSVSSFDGELQNTISKLSDINRLTVTDPTQLDFEPTPWALELQTRSHNGSSTHGVFGTIEAGSTCNPLNSHALPTNMEFLPTASSTSSSSMVLRPCSSSEALSLPSWTVSLRSLFHHRWLLDEYRAVSSIGPRDSDSRRRECSYDWNPDKQYGREKANLMDIVGHGGVVSRL